MLMAKNKEKVAKKTFADQFDDEEVLFIFRKHPIVMRKGLVIGAFMPLLGVMPAAINPDLGMTELSVWSGQPEYLGCTEHVLIKLDGLGGAIDDEVRSYGMVAIRNRFYCHGDLLDSVQYIKARKRGVQ